MFNCVGDGEDGGGDTNRVSEADHRESGEAEGRLYVSESQGGSIAGFGRNPFGKDLHQNKIGEGGIVGSTAANFRGVRRGEGI